MVQEQVHQPCSRHGPFGKVRFSPAQHLLSLRHSRRVPCHERKPPGLAGENEAQEAAIPTRMQLSPSLHLWLHQTSLPSSCTAQVATLALSTWKSQNPVYEYNCIKKRGRGAKQYDCTVPTYRAIARATTCYLLVCLRCRGVPCLCLDSTSSYEVRYLPLF